MKKGFKIAYFHLKLYQSRLNFGKVDHVVDLAQQFFTALANQANKFLSFLGIDVGLGQQFGKTQNGVHGGADFVRKVGQKGAFKAIALLRFYLILVQRSEERRVGKECRSRWWG